MNRKTRIQPIDSGRDDDREADENGYDRPSKSQLKREMHALTDCSPRAIHRPARQ